MGNYRNHLWRPIAKTGDPVTPCQSYPVDDKLIQESKIWVYISSYHISNIPNDFKSTTAIILI